MERDTAKPKTLVLIPTYKESATIYDLVKRCREYGDVCVLDSSPHGDETEAIAKKAGATVKRYPVEVEIAGKISSGFNTAIKGNYDWAITIDAGLSHKPGQVLSDDRYDVVFGSRFFRHKYLYNRKLRRYLISRCAACFFNFIWGTRYRDVTSGYRAYSVPFLRSIDVSDYRSQHFEFHTEMAAKFTACGARVKEVPIQYTYGGSTFKWKYIPLAMKRVLQWRFKKTSK